MSAFSGHLSSHEVLLLWDRIVGHDSLSVIAVMAVAVMEFRSSNLFKATSYSEAEVCECLIYRSVQGKHPLRAHALRANSITI